MHSFVLAATSTMTCFKILRRWTNTLQQAPFQPHCPQNLDSWSTVSRADDEDEDIVNLESYVSVFLIYLSKG